MLVVALLAGGADVEALPVGVHQEVVEDLEEDLEEAEVVVVAEALVEAIAVAAEEVEDSVVVIVAAVVVEASGDHEQYMIHSSCPFDLASLRHIHNSYSGNILRKRSR